MDFHLQAYEAVPGIIGVAHGLLDGLDACSGRTEHDRVFACCLRLRQIAVDAVVAVGLELQQKGISSKIVDDVLAESGRNEADELRKMIARKAKKYPDEQKLIQYLLRQGFNYSDILDELSSIESSSV